MTVCARTYLAERALLLLQARELEVLFVEEVVAVRAQHDRNLWHNRLEPSRPHPYTNRDTIGAQANFQHVVRPVSGASSDQRVVDTALQLTVGRDPRGRNSNEGGEWLSITGRWLMSCAPIFPLFQCSVNTSRGSRDARTLRSILTGMPFSNTSPVINCRENRSPLESSHPSWPP